MNERLPPSVDAIPYEERPPGRGVRLVRHADGVSIQFVQDFAYGTRVVLRWAGMRGLLFLVASPFLFRFMGGPGSGWVAVGCTAIYVVAPALVAAVVYGYRIVPTISVRRERLAPCVPAADSENPQA